MIKTMLIAGRTFSADALRGLRRPSHKTQYDSETVTLSMYYDKSDPYNGHQNAQFFCNNVNLSPHERILSQQAPIVTSIRCDPEFKSAVSKRHLDHQIVISSK